MLLYKRKRVPGSVFYYKWYRVTFCCIRGRGFQIVCFTISGRELQIIFAVKEKERS